MSKATRKIFGCGKRSQLYRSLLTKGSDEFFEDFYRGETSLLKRCSKEGFVYARSSRLQGPLGRARIFAQSPVSRPSGQMNRRS